MNQRVKFNSELVNRYDQTGPRYTSYPTAVQFHEGFDANLYRRYVELSNDDLIPAPLSLYVHLPFCRSLCYYCGCTKKITRHSDPGLRYLEFLSNEIRLQAALFDRDRQVSQLHFGGGTPTFFDDIQLEQLMANLAHQFHFASPKEREFSIEIDPRTVDQDRLSVLADLGFNRISLGVQDFDAKVQAAVNREQDAASTLALLEQAKKLGFHSTSIDLIYGLPLQTRESFSQTLQTIIDARPGRLAVYNYAHMPKVFRSQRLIRESDLPAPEVRLELMDLTIQMLCDAGYVYIGMDHFALPDDELCVAQREGHLHRNFQGYSTRSECDLVGLGVSAIGKIGNSFVQNLKEIRPWSAALAENALPVWRGLAMTAEDRLRQAVIESIMCHGQADYEALGSRFGVDFEQHFALELHRLETLARDGLVEMEEDRFTVTPEGRLLLRAIAMVFDEYLGDRNGRPQFSKVI
jgi:oxygen-independent coproporphyrinogen-3 oxidase